MNNNELQFNFATFPGKQKIIVLNHGRYSGSPSF
jgi:hypothetical protein